MQYRPKDAPVPPTTDEDALLAAIAAAPLDDAPRLVYADWLQERGHEARAEYLRTVVRLLHPPEDLADVERCEALAPATDPAWRQQVGGLFEVVLDGTRELLLMAYLFRAVIKLVIKDGYGMWEAGQPIRVQTGLTREDAAQYVRTFAGNLSGFTDEGQPPLRLVVRLM